ncbi:MAG TPA: ABC transporter permease [Candidatus Angelobacter sp.]
MTFFRSIPYSVRSLMRAPSFTATAIIVLTLGITANTTIFTLVDELLLNPFPYRDPQRLVMVWEANPARGGIAGERTPAAWSNFDTWRTENHVFEAMEAYEIFLGYNLTGLKTPEHVSAARATPGFFNMLGVNAAQGRTFLWQDDTPNAAPIVLLSEKFATKHFPVQNPLGQRLLLDGEPHNVVGVLPKGFHLPAFFEGLSEYKPEIWLPLRKVAANDPPQLATRRRLVVWGRLKPNVSLAQARDDMKAVAARRRQEDPELNQGFDINVFPLEVENTLPDFRNDLRVFSIAAGIVLLLACLNLAGLMVIRTAARNKNFAIMAALGASRRALISPILSETALLAVISTFLGYFAAYGAVHLIAILKPSDINGPERLALNFHSLIFTSCLSILVILIVGFLSAHTVSGSEVIHALKSATFPGRRSSHLRSVLITVQISAAVTLTITAVLLIRSFQHILNVDQGFATQGVLTAHLALPPQRYATPQARAQFCQQLLAKVQAIPEVETAALADYLPLRAIRIIAFEIEGRTITERNAAPFTDFADVTPGFFKSMGMALRQGRFFTEQDAETDPPNVVIINEALARQFWPNQNPIGSHVRRVSTNGPPAPWQTVIGVVADFHQVNTETPARPELLWPTKALSEMTLVLRTKTPNPLSLSSPVQQTVWNLDHDQPVSDIESLEQIVADYNSQRRFNMLTISAFAGFCVLLTIVGIYGLTAAFISSRIQDIGIRFALGAQHLQVYVSLLRPTVLPMLIGIALGLLFSFLAKRLIAAVLFQTSPLDPLTCITTPAVLLAVLVVTSFAATQRAARIDPAKVLRQE